MHSFKFYRNVEVGDFFTALVSSEGRFDFLAVSTLFFDPNAFAPGENGELTAIASGENAEYRFETLVPGAPDKPAVFGFHYPKASICFLYASNGRSFPDFKKVYRGLEGDFLDDQVEQEFGHRPAHVQLRHTSDPPKL